MKKFLFVALLAIASISAYAQPRAIGANIGGNIGFSYQHGFGETNMLDIDVHTNLFHYGWWGIGAHVTYDWIDPFGATFPWDNKGEWHWYMGVGGAGGLYSFAPTWYAGVAGHIGFEYDFWFPFQLSLDWRPTIGVWGTPGAIAFNTWGLYEGITLGVRYKF